jgi:hypothetical protein
VVSILAVHLVADREEAAEQNPNIEFRNPKQYLNPNVKNSKQERLDFAF